MLAVIVLVVDVIAVPVGITLGLARNRHRLTLERDKAFVQTYGQLFQAYKPSRFFWCVAPRRVCAVLCAVYRACS